MCRTAKVIAEIPNIAGQLPDNHEKWYDLRSIVTLV